MKERIVDGVFFAFHYSEILRFKELIHRARALSEDEEIRSKAEYTLVDLQRALDLIDGKRFGQEITPK